MRCRRLRATATGRCAPGRDRTRRAFQRPAPHAGSHFGLDGAAALVARVAAMIPPPGAALCADDESWAAFSGVLGEAAELVVSAVGDRGAPVLRALMTSPLADDPVPRLLLERALGALPGARDRD